MLGSSGLTGAHRRSHRLWLFRRSLSAVAWRAAALAAAPSRPQTSDIWRFDADAADDGWGNADGRDALSSNEEDSSEEDSSEEEVDPFAHVPYMPIGDGL